MRLLEEMLLTFWNSLLEVLQHFVKGEDVPHTNFLWQPTTCSSLSEEMIHMHCLHVYWGMRLTISKFEHATSHNRRAPYLVSSSQMDSSYSMSRSTTHTTMTLFALVLLELFLRPYPCLARPLARLCLSPTQTWPWFVRRECSCHHGKDKKFLSLLFLPCIDNSDYLFYRMKTIEMWPFWVVYWLEWPRCAYSRRDSFLHP